jgi:cysteine desulfurase family protein
MAAEADRIIFQARESIAKLFNIPHSGRIIFTSNTTGALNVAILGLLRPGDHCVTTSTEHNSVVRPLHFLARSGVAVTRVRATPQGVVNPDHIERAINERTRLVVVTHASNVIGAINPLAEIIRAAHHREVPVLVDAAQTAGSVPIDVGKLELDLLACPGHKGLYGPQGTGLLYINPHVSLRPIVFGGTGSRSDFAEMPDFLPDRYEAGTLNTPGIAGLAAGIDFLLDTGVHTVRAHEMMLCGRLIDGLRNIDGVTVYGPKHTQQRSSVVLFQMAGVDPATIGDRLNSEFDIAVRVGLHCAPDAHRTAGTFPLGGVRMSPGYFNTIEEIDLAIDALAAIARSRTAAVKIA